MGYQTLHAYDWWTATGRGLMASIPTDTRVKVGDKVHFDDRDATYEITHIEILRGLTDPPVTKGIAVAVREINRGD